MGAGLKTTALHVFQRCIHCSQLPNKQPKKSSTPGAEKKANLEESILKMLFDGIVSQLIFVQVNFYSPTGQIREGVAYV